jgi:hypothetical protein
MSRDQIARIASYTFGGAPIVGLICFARLSKAAGLDFRAANDTLAICSLDDRSRRSCVGQRILQTRSGNQNSDDNIRDRDSFIVGDYICCAFASRVSLSTVAISRESECDVYHGAAIGARPPLSDEAKPRGFGHDNHGAVVLRTRRRASPAREWSRSGNRLISK